MSAASTCFWLVLALSMLAVPHLTTSPPWPDYCLSTFSAVCWSVATGVLWSRTRTRAIAMSSWLMPIEGPPTSSQARAIPMKKHTITRIAIPLAAPTSRAFEMSRNAKNTWRPNAATRPPKNRMSRGGTGWDSRTRRRDSNDAATKSSPSSPTTNPGQRKPTLGTSPNSAIASALLNDVRAADALTRWAWLALSPVNRSWATEIATNSNPISAPATPADAARKVSNEGGVTGLPVWIVRGACARRGPPRVDTSLRRPRRQLDPSGDSAGCALKLRTHAGADTAAICMRLVASARRSTSGRRRASLRASGADAPESQNPRTFSGRPHISCSRCRRERSRTVWWSRSRPSRVGGSLAPRPFAPAGGSAPHQPISTE